MVVVDGSFSEQKRVMAVRHFGRSSGHPTWAGRQGVLKFWFLPLEKMNDEQAASLCLLLIYPGITHYSSVLDKDLGSL